MITYGLADAVRGVGRDRSLATGATLGSFGSRCTVRASAPGRADETLGELRLGVPGRHNLLNGLGAVAVGLEVGLEFSRIAAGLAEFRGAERRFQMRGRRAE